jgi:glutamine phosphoribosylpyrophosphate amidotransferase
MCEQYVACSAEPFRLEALWAFTERLERYGLAGFGWGATWLAADGRLRSHRDIGSFREDPERGRVGGEETTALLMHLRRPSRFSTIGIPDTQPFDDPAGRYAFSHNGDLANDRAFRARYRAEGRLKGRADTEVGARWLEDEWDRCSDPAAAIRTLHATFGGDANLATIDRSGTVVHYAGNEENPVWTFRLGVISIASTAVYSIDRSLFQLVAPGAQARRLVRKGGAVRITADGRVVAA